MRIVLASRSEQRIRLLREMGYDFEIVPADIDETPAAGMDAHSLSRHLAERKARAVAATLKDGLVIGADTVIAAGGKIIGKPVDDQDAVRILRRLSGQRQSVITGVCLVDCASGRGQVESDETIIHMRLMNDEQIAAYVASGLSTGASGAYSYQVDNDPHVESFEGSCTNILGLPVELLGEMLARWNIEP